MYAVCCLASHGVASQLCVLHLQAAGKQDKKGKGGKKK